MQNKNVLFLTQAAMIAALYVVLTLIANALGLANQAIQLRFSEALTILPYFTPAAIPGLTIGCLISNIFAGGVLLDVIFGTAATLIGALGTYAIGRLFRKSPGISGKSAAASTKSSMQSNSDTAAFDSRHGSATANTHTATPDSATNNAQPRRFQPRKILLTLPPIIANTIIVPLVLKYGYGSPALIFNAVTVGAGEIISCGILGILLLLAIEKRGLQLFN